MNPCRSGRLPVVGLLALALVACGGGGGGGNGDDDDGDDAALNAAPAFDSATASTSAPENQTGTGYTASSRVSDADGDSLTFSLTGGADVDLFVIDDDTGELTFVKAPDFEFPTSSSKTNDYVVEVTANDGNDGSDTQSVTVSVTEVDSGADNSAPSFDSGNSATAAENQTGTGYTAEVTDPDDDSITFGLAGGPDLGAFNIDGSSGVLTFKSAPDFESPADSDGDNEYVVDISADDGEGGTTTQRVFVSVTNVNEDPAFTSGGNASMTEKQTDTGYTAAATDPESDPVTFSVSSGGIDGDLFTITSGGDLDFKSAPDFSAPADNDADNDYIVELRADDGNGGSATLTVTVTVTESLPTALDDSVTMEENTTATINVLQNDDFGNDGPAGSAITVTSGPSNGTAVVDDGGTAGDPTDDTIDYTPSTDFTGSDSFVYAIADADADTDNATVSVTVEASGGGTPLSCYENRAGGSATDPPLTTTLEFFQSSAGLQAVEPSTPVNVIDVDTEATFSSADAAPVLDGAWQSGGGVTSPAVARVVYPITGGLRQVRTDPSNFNPAAMSSESEAINAFRVGHDFHNPANACIAYRLSSGGDWKMTRLGASGSDAPADFPGVPLVAFNDNSSGAHDGWLTLDGGELKRISGSGSVGSGLGGLSGISEVDLLDSLPDGTAFLNIDGALFAYEPSTDTLTDFSFAFPNNIKVFAANAPEFAVADDSQLYFTDEYNLYRTELPAGSVETLETFPGDAVKPADPEADRLAVTNTRVIWTYTSDTGVKIRSIVKSTGAASTLDTLPDTNISAFNDNQTYLARSDQWFFYTALATSGERTAVALRDDGSTEITYADNRWTGANLNPRPGTDMGDALQQIYLLSGTDNAGETLQFVPAGSPSSNTTLGTLPADTTSNDDAFQLGGGIGSARLAQVSVGSGSGLESDILFVDTSSTTLLLATDDNEIDETPVALF